MRLLVLPCHKEAVSKGQDRQPLTQAVSPPRAELSAKVPASGTSDSTEKQAEVKKNKRERKEERQKNRKKEKKELKLENHQENSKNQKPKKHKTAQAAGGEALRSAGKKSQRKVGEVEGAVDRAKDGAGACAGDAEEEPTKARPAKRKQKHLEGAWQVYALGFVKRIVKPQIGAGSTLNQVRPRA